MTISKLIESLSKTIKENPGLENIPVNVEIGDRCVPVVGYKYTTDVDRNFNSESTLIIKIC